MKIIILIFSIVTFMTLIGCKKESTSTPKSSYCKMTNGFVDEHYVLNIQYDSNGKLISYSDIWENRVTVDYSKAEEVTIGNDTATVVKYLIGPNNLAITKINYRFSSNKTYIDSISYEYNSEGYITKIVTKYYVKNNGDSTLNNSYGTASPVQEFTINDLNTTSCIEKELNGEIIKTISYEYLSDKISPFFGNDPLTFRGKISKNLLSKKIELTSGGSTRTINFAYTFDSNGNILTRKETSDGQLQSNTTVSFGWQCE